MAREELGLKEGRLQNLFCVSRCIDLEAMRSFIPACALFASLYLKAAPRERETRPKRMELSLGEMAKALLEPTCQAPTASQKLAGFLG